ncbi:GDSL esterase/lipase 6-like [Cryptomeria japonica]|uniref:GDSL esterase/lipase 6-like n=1 Tax=Cryptomeria japonica TaxID=3369 RepID=UPI0027DA3C5D|nr:GDSL esterase/lipase 6-like [Cryptomeria japonica]
MESSVLGILVALWLITCFAAAEKESFVPAMYVFGDSLADVGNNNYIPDCQGRANYPPYGISFFPYPTGRFTNGRTVFDFVATYLGLPFAPPYLQPKANFTSGINFASGGSGLLDSTDAGQYSENLTGAAQANLGNSLYGIITGSNDILLYVTNSTLGNTTTEEFITLLLAKYDEYIKRLYDCGARKFLVLNVLPVGCSPTERLLGIQTYHGGCIEPLTKVIEAYNTAFNSFVTQLNENLTEGTIIKFNAYDLLTDMIQNGEAYGFRDTTSACCGAGKFGTEINCGKTDPPVLFCNDTSAYVFWDGAHGTQKVYSIFSEQIWSGNSSVIYPFNLSTLALGETSLKSQEAQTLFEL